jgi:hypothetical protein
LVPQLERLERFQVTRVPYRAPVPDEERHLPYDEEEE